MRAWLWFGILLVAAASVPAQIRTDGTAGPAVTLSGPHFQIPETLGTTRGANLFHSFYTFNLNSGEAATFTGPNSIANVFSRVTGGSASSINGQLQCTIPGANFFFINPAGVLFGPNASVDVQGAFAVTTADYIRFADGGRFDARMPANDVLTVANPVAFGFLTPLPGQTPATITFDNCALQLPAGRTLTVAAGAVQMQNDSAVAPGGTGVAVPGGTLQVAAVASAGELPLTGLDTASFSALGDISLSGNSIFSTSASGGGGRFLFRGHNLGLNGVSWIANDTYDSGFGGASRIDLSGTLSLSYGGSIMTRSTGQACAGSLTITAQSMNMAAARIDGGTWGEGPAANITINAPTLSLQAGSTLSADSHGAGAGGAITLNVPALTLQSAAWVSADAYGAGPGGTIAVNAPTFSLMDGSWLSTDTYGAGHGGTVMVNSQSVRVLHGGGISSDNTAGATGNAGRIIIGAGTLDLDNGNVSAASRGTGAGGLVQVSCGALDITGQNRQGIIDTSTSGVGPAGNISITAGGLTLDPGGWISSETTGAGAAGAITIQATDVALNEGEIRAGTSGAGAGGDVLISSDTLSLNGPVGTTRIDTSGWDVGHAGNIFITTGELALDQGAMIVAAPFGAAGDGGEIQISAREVTLRNGSGIGSTVFGGGNAGRIRLDVSGRCLLDSSDISAASMSLDPGGTPGDIVIQANALELRGSGLISSDTYGYGAGGRISLTANTMVLANSASVRAATGPNSYGKGGDIAVNAGTLQILDSGYLSASSLGFGSGGTVRIHAGQLQVTGTLGMSAPGISSFAAETGPAGTIDVQAGMISLVNGSISSWANLGDAGSITLQSGNSIILNHSSLSVRSVSGNAGTVSLIAPGSILLQQSGVGAFAGLNGGNITIDPPIFGMIDSTLNANAVLGNGGHISIAADFFYQLGNSFITADSQNQSAQAGTIAIHSAVDFANVLSALPVGPLQEGGGIREGCARKNPRANSLIVRGKGGVAARPDAFLPVYDSQLEPVNGL